MTTDAGVDAMPLSFAPAPSVIHAGQPPRGSIPPSKAGRRRVAIWMGLALLVVAIVAAPLGGRPTARVSAVTEEVEINLDYEQGDTPNLVFDEAEVEIGDSTVRVIDGEIEFHRSALVRVTRTSPETLEIFVEGVGGTIGNLFQDTRLLGALDSTSSITVPLRGPTAAPFFYFAFHADRITVGSVVGANTDQYMPLLRSGRVFIRDRSLFGTQFESASRTLQLGDLLEVPAADHPARGLGYGFVRVEGNTGIIVRFDRTNANAKVVDLNNKPDVLKTTAIDRIFHDRTLAVVWLALLFFVIHPGASHLRDALINQLKAQYHAMHVRRGSVRPPDRSS